MAISPDLPKMGPRSAAPLKPAAPAISAGPAVVDSLATSQADVLHIRYPSRTERFKEALHDATTGLSRLGLPFLGGMVAGLPGVGAGLALSALDHAFLSTNKPSANRLLLTAGVTGVLAAGCTLLGPAAGAALLGASVVLPALVSWRQSGKKDPEVKVDLQAFAQGYSDKVRQALAESKPDVKLNVEIPQKTDALSQEKFDKLCAQATVQACQVAATNLPPGVAVSLAGETARQLFSPNDRQRLDEALLRKFDAKPTTSQPELEGVAVLHVAKNTGPSPALATANNVILDEKFLRDKDPVTRDFVLGHELSHVRHQDAIFKLGVTSLKDMVTLASDLGPKDVKVVLTQLILQSMLAQESRQMELRADHEGLEFAVRRGHSAQEVEAAADKLFAGGQATAGILDTHPPAAERLKALRSTPLNKAT